MLAASTRPTRRRTRPSSTVTSSSGGTRGRRVEHFRHGDASAHAQDRPSVGDRAGRGPARLRLLLRAAQADRPASLDVAGRARPAIAAVGSERGRHLREMLDELGPTFVKFGQLLSTRPDVVPPDIVAELRGLQDDVRPFPFAQVRAVVEEELGLTLEQAFVALRRAADRGRLDRPGAPRRASERRRGRGQGAAPERAAPDRVRPGAALPGRAHDQGARPRARLHRRPRARGRVRALDPAGARLQARGAPRRHVPPQLRRLRSSSSCRRSTGTTRASRMLTLEFLDGVQLADLDSRGDLAGGAARACLPGHADLDGDDLRARVLPRRPASRERARARRATGSASSTSGSSGKLTDEDMARLTRLFIDAATENVDALPRRLAELGVRYPKEREEEFRDRAARALLPLLRREPAPRSTRSR